ncbi:MULTISPECIES: hypothetical protein [Pantoea]|uniref:hypothetical protein n=1 Tax=Pantoea TaxID=53335 RepID=UPI001232ADA0|nr:MULTISPECIES: hypothetical protein [Pantoea]KAA6093709.1 hypothetical protein F3I21_22825 [Pantoea sp. B_9]KAA6106163.1 hypothetical protein F3I18_23800 [Pantoea sp. B_10]KAA8669019.1 hypothetical protein F4W08_17110 [Pantoea dispersa]
MKNPTFDYDSVYGFIRYFYISALPGFAPCEPHEIMNAHLQSSGSALRMAKPGMTQVSSDEYRSETEVFLRDSTKRTQLYDDIVDMTEWLHQQGYLNFNPYGSGSYCARDLLLRTPSLNFELRR